MSSSFPVPATAIAPGAAVIDRSNAPARLVVDGVPYQVRGVELHNSTSSSPTAYADGLATTVQVGANTVLAAVTWEMIQPAEDTFDLSSVQTLIDGAREAGVKLVILWFGAWKNGASSYPPLWVQTDWERFPRCVHEDGTLSDTLTPFGGTDLDLDAFLAVVRFVEEYDATDRTVLMIQIENEIGLLGSSRDHSTSADTVFTSAIPDPLRAALAHRPGFDTDTTDLAWGDVTDEPLGRDEAFMASGYATHVQRLACAAREITDIPFFVNAWLDSDLDLDIPGFTVAGGQTPGMYPSGGPLPRVADVWRTLAPSIDIFAPDVYHGVLDDIYRRFSDMSGALFIPEQRVGEDGVAAAFLAYGRYGAIGVSPFGVDSRTDEELAALTDGYRILATIAEAFTTPDGTRTPSHGFSLTDDTPTTTWTHGDTNITVQRSAGLGVDLVGSRGYGIILATEEDTYVFAGRGFTATFTSTDPAIQVRVGSVQELADRDTALVGRRLNGDETASGSWILHPPRERPLSNFPIASGHAHTGVSSVRIYRLPVVGR